MRPKGDGPPLVLKASNRGIVPASSLDAEILKSLRLGTTLRAEEIKTPPSKYLRAWWELMNAVVKADVGKLSAKALSNEILLSFDLVEREATMGRGDLRDPMSLNDFTDDQLKQLLELAKLKIHLDIIPGVDISTLIKGARSV